MTLRQIFQTLAALAVALVCASAAAEPQTQAQPWHVGISEDSKQTANTLMKEGLALHRDLRWAEAVDKYKFALKHWPVHPEIHFYMARALDKLGKPLQAYENLKRALRWGAAGLTSSEEYELAQSIQTRLLRDELGEIKVTCDVPGAAVSLNGERWFAGPDTRRKVVRPGVHQIEASRRGYHTVDQSKTLLAGEQASMKLRMDAESGIRFKRRWRVWMPWTVLGGGVVLGASGAGLLWWSRRDFDRYDRHLDNECLDIAGCTLEEMNNHGGLRRAAEAKQGISIGLLGAAGAALVTGTVLMFFNQPEPYREEYRDPNRWQITPLVSTESVGASVSRSF